MPNFIGETRVVYINTDARLNPSSTTSTEFYIELPNWTNDNDYNRIGLANITIPKTWYLMDDAHNTFTITELVDRTITIPVGNYSFRSLGNSIQTLLNTGGIGWVYTVSANTLIGKFVITVTGNGATQPIITISTLRLRNILGFDNTANTFVTNSLTSSKVVNLQLANNCLVICSMSGATNNVLANIISGGEDFSLITYLNPNLAMLSKPLINGDSNIVYFRIVDFRNNLFEPLDLNGATIILTLVFWKYNDTNEKILALDILDRQVLP